VITVEWLESQIETVTAEMEAARKREEAANEAVKKATKKYGDAMRTRVHLAGILRGLREELEFARDKE
jgi:hypothetical protein